MRHQFPVLFSAALLFSRGAGSHAHEKPIIPTESATKTVDVVVNPGS